MNYNLSNNKKPTIKWVNLLLAEDMRFELTEACTSPPFQDGALNRSANPPVLTIIPNFTMLSLEMYKFYKKTDELFIAIT